MIGVSAASGLATLSKAEQPTQNPQIEQALMEARQISSDLADKVRGLLLKEIEIGGWAGAVKVCSENRNSTGWSLSEHDPGIGYHTSCWRTDDRIEIDRFEQILKIHHKVRKGHEQPVQFPSINRF
jgi:hypothetical protein